MKKLLIALTLLLGIASGVMGQATIFDVDSLPVQGLDSNGVPLVDSTGQPIYVGQMTYRMFLPSDNPDSTLAQEFQIITLGGILHITHVKIIDDPNGRFKIEPAMWITPPDSILVHDTVTVTDTVEVCPYSPYDVNRDSKVNMADLFAWLWR